MLAASTVFTGLREVVDQIEPYTRYWDARNQTDVDGDGPLLLAFGDSTALGVGASQAVNSYIGRLGEALSLRDGTEWRIINLSQSGARLKDGLERQLPIAHELPTPDLTVCCLGSNDLTWGIDSSKIHKQMEALIEALPPETIVCPAAGASQRARSVNKVARTTATGRGLAFVNPWGEPGPGAFERLAGDRFHPNDLGYALMARPLARHVDAPEPDLPH